MPPEGSESPLPKPERFVWPPRRPVLEAPTDAPTTEVVRGPELRRTWRDAVREAVEDTRRIWLDQVVPRLDERLAAAGFKADPPGAYCFKCGLSVERPTGADGCDACAGRQPGWRRVIRLGTYTPPLANIIREIKFSKWRRLGQDLGVVLSRQLAEQLPSPRPPVVLVPVPMSWRRRMFRGMDHTLAICRGIRSGLRGDVRIAHLLKRRHGPSQLQVLPSERSGNVGRMILARKFGFRSVRDGAVVVVVDDVMTTGATMRASCRAVGEGLAGAGVGKREVWALIAARTEEPDGDRDEEGGAV